MTARNAKVPYKQVRLHRGKSDCHKPHGSICADHQPCNVARLLQEILKGQLCDWSVRALMAVMQRSVLILPVADPPNCQYCKYQHSSGVFTSARSSSMRRGGHEWGTLQQAWQLRRVIGYLACWLASPNFWSSGTMKLMFMTQDIADVVLLQDYNSPLKGGVYAMRTASGAAAGPATPKQPGRLAGQSQQPPGDALQLPGPFGDLFQSHDIAAGPSSSGPGWPRWNLTRPFLNGDFLLQVACPNKPHSLPLLLPLRCFCSKCMHQ